MRAQEPAYLWAAHLHSRTVDKPLANFSHGKAPPRERFSGASGALGVLGSACSHSDMRTANVTQCSFEIQVTDLAEMTDHAPRDYGSALRALSTSAAVTLVVPLPKNPLTKLATAASSSSLCPRANGGMKACSTGSGAFEPARRIAIRLVASGSLTVRLPRKSA